MGARKAGAHLAPKRRGNQEDPKGTAAQRSHRQSNPTPHARREVSIFAVAAGLLHQQLQSASETLPRLVDICPWAEHRPAMTLSLYLLLTIALGASLIELGLWFAGNSWYFRVGPTLSVIRIPTTRDRSTVVAKIGLALESSGHAVRRSGASWSVRRPWWEFSTYPRVVLHLSDATTESEQRLEIRPFLTMFLLLVPCIWGWLAEGQLAWLLGAVGGLIAAGYVYFFLSELPRVRQRLTLIVQAASLADASGPLPASESAGS